METTHIRLSGAFKRWLEENGKKGESYEDIIKRIIKEGKKKNAKI